MPAFHFELNRICK